MMQYLMLMGDAFTIIASNF